MSGRPAAPAGGPAAYPPGSLAAGATRLLQAADTGEVAAALLAAQPRRRVVALFARSAYLEGGACLLAPEHSRGPLAARLPSWPALRAGERVAVDPGRVWRPPGAARPDVAALRAAVGAALRRVDWAAWLAAWPSRDAGLGFARRIARLPDGAPDLVGLGPGLTPAGDDALAGYALVRRALGGGAPAVDLGRTGWISAGLLACALAGLPAEDEAWLLARPSAAAAGRVAAHGATSGPATLLGMAAALPGEPGGDRR